VSRVGEVWDTGKHVFVILEEDESNAYPEESICVILILHSDRDDEAVGRTTGQWVPRVQGKSTSGATSWKQIASFQS
jgi:hypothetical protein